MAYIGKSKLYLALTLLLAILTGFLVYRYLSGMYKPPSEPMAAQVVATAEIAAGTRITAGMVKVEEVPVKYAHPSAAPSGVAGLLKPGHRVDVLVTYSGDDPIDAAVAVTVVQDVPVLVVGQDMIGAEEPSEAKNVTLALAPDDAETVALGEMVGHIKLSARPAGDAEKPYIPHTTVDRMLRLYP